MISAVIIAIVGIAYFVVALDQFFLQANFWNGLVWLGYAIAQAGLWRLTVQ